MEDIISVEEQFRQKLISQCSDGKKTVLMKKSEYFELIEELKVASSAEVKNRRQYYILQRLVIKYWEVIIFNSSCYVKLMIEVKSWLFCNSYNITYNYITYII